MLRLENLQIIAYNRLKYTKAIVRNKCNMFQTSINYETNRFTHNFDIEHQIVYDKRLSLAACYWFSSF